MKKIELDKINYMRDFKEEEAYRTLRTNLGFCGKNIKVIAITSCIPNEGKTTVSMKLSEAIADAGKKVIVVDADMRKSVMISQVKMKAITGLTHYLCGQYKIEEVICNTQFENLDVIFSGPYPPNPSELLASSDFETLINQLKERYDYVIIDTPPLGAVIDSAIVSKVCDGYILVIEANKISLKSLKRVVVQLKKTNCKILGTVLNKVTVKNKSYYNEYLQSIN
ncbi:MAG: CpsD/CapB family tyrosine-protein kinase [Anaerocolumna sp.]